MHFARVRIHVRICNVQWEWKYEEEEEIKWAKITNEVILAIVWSYISAYVRTCIFLSHFNYTERRKTTSTKKKKDSLNTSLNKRYKKCGIKLNWRRSQTKFQPAEHRLCSLLKCCTSKRAWRKTTKYIK